MTFFRVLILLFAVLLNSVASAQDANCSSVPKIFSAVRSEDGCHCGKALANAQLTPPKGLRLVAACGLTWGHENKIDLVTTQVKLNGYTEGYYPLALFTWLDRSNCAVRSG